ncbi:lipid-A-disaccharide synthase [Fluviispira multicolorata]|uniref:Lipid-A-disaccharide synthase n=1 Tax=Fluviispira multicolorata TaxID=2654512 RepID=A0A833JDA5_9BACT|nr:lipid-A-disaccharide synthase [Fluviispira multicolorata]KAB8028462.1 lipid-A-disaccharide synthase [Fluviispira multicolorata]
MEQNLSSGICIIAGEASGDAQASLLIKAMKDEFKARDLPEKHFFGCAGPLMRNEGFDCIINVEDLAVFGFTEIISHYSVISKLYKKILQEIKIRKPEVVIFVDYPGFNLRLIQEVYALGFTTVYHIPPKAWSHGEGRTKILQENSHLVTSILPFEIQFFKERGVNAKFIGNPLKDAVDAYLTSHPNKKVPYKIGMLPGSRKSEIKKLLPLLIEAFINLSERLDKVTGAIPIAKTLDPNFVKDIARKTAEQFGRSKEWLEEKISFGIGNAYEVMNTSSYAWVCSGTATLETAFFSTPMSVFYKVSPITAMIVKRILKVKYISLVNLATNRETIPEYIQENALAINLVNHALKLLNDIEIRSEMIGELVEIQKMFPENSANNAAKEIINTIEKYDVPLEQKFRIHKDIWIQK